MEDDVYRKNNFDKYWNQLLNLNCDYVSFDAFFLVFKINQLFVPSDFVSLKEHRATGFNIFYKKFFDRFETIEQFEKIFCCGAIDMTFTYNPLFINYTPKEQICSQIISKYSTTSLVNTDIYSEYYLIAENELKKFIK